MPRIQYRAVAFRCGWGAESAADRIFAGPSPWTMEAPVDLRQGDDSRHGVVRNGPCHRHDGRENEGGCRNPESPRHPSSRRWERIRGHFIE